MQTLMVILIVGASVGWFAHRLYRTATADDPACSGGCGCECGKGPLADYRKERNNQTR